LLLNEKYQYFKIKSRYITGNHEDLVTIQAQEKGRPEKASFKPLKIFMEFFLKVEV
jgi:hypothetical protein